MYSDIKLNFSCESVNLINTKYILHLTKTELILGKATKDPNPKYVINLSEKP